MNPVRARGLVTLCLAASAAACGARASEPLGEDGGFAALGGDAGVAVVDDGASTSDAAGTALGGARDEASRGLVPDAADVTPELLLHAHSVTDDPAACDGHAFCDSSALAVAPSLATGQTAYWVRLRFASAIDAPGFVRPPIDMAVTIDRSESMAIDLDQVYDALGQLAGRLRSDDRLALVVFNDTPEVVRALGPVGDRGALLSAARAHGAQGGFDLHAGVVQAFDVLASAGDASGRLRRVMVFSCANPDDSGSDTLFYDQVQAGVSTRIGTTFYGVLLGGDATAAETLQGTWGGDYTALENTTTLASPFGPSFEARITPVGYDLAFRLTPAPGLSITHAYSAQGTLAATGLRGTTAFADVPRGSVIARLEPARGSALPANAGTIQLGYAAERAIVNEDPRLETTPLALPAGVAPGTTYYATPTVRRAVALTNEGEVVHAALLAWHAGQHAAAQTQMAQVEQYLATELAATGDTELASELDFVRQVQRAMNGA